LRCFILSSCEFIKRDIERSCNDFYINQEVRQLGNSTYCLRTTSWHDWPNELIDQQLVFEDPGMRINMHHGNSMWHTVLINDSVKIAQYKYAQKQIESYRQRIKPLDLTKK
jgi:hypothetical protein